MWPALLQHFPKLLKGQACVWVFYRPLCNHIQVLIVLMVDMADRVDSWTSMAMSEAPRFLLIYRWSAFSHRHKHREPKNKTALKTNMSFHV